MNPHRLKAYLLLLIVAVIWGIAGPVIKLTLGGLPANIFLLYRFFLSSLAAILFFFFTGFKLPRNPKVICQIIIYSLLTSTIALGFLFWGTDRTSLIDMSLISIFGPILIILSGLVFLKEKVTVQEKIGIIIAFIGSFLIILEPILGFNHGSPDRLIGNLFILISLGATALAAVVLKKLLREGVSPLFLTNIAFVVGFLTFLPITLVENNFATIITTIRNVPLPFHLGVFYMAILSGTLAYTLGNIAQKTIEVSEAALFAYIYPIFSAILAVVLLGDKLTLPAMIGSIITFIGVLLAEIKKKKYN